VRQSQIPINGAILYFKNRIVFFDYSDDKEFVSIPCNYDFYFKRSLDINELKSHVNVFPLNFQVNFSTKPFKLMSLMDFGLIKNSGSLIELIRAVDAFGILTNDSHRSVNIDNFKRVKNSTGKVIFMTRLWDPTRNDDEQEKERRRVQNNFRINACRIIKKVFPDSMVGVYPDDFGIKMASDILLDLGVTKKKNYLNILSQYDIAIADDGLKDTPGWKIGEYIMCGKAIISTPINVLIEDFFENINYLSTGERDNYQILPDLVQKLLKNKLYEEIQNNNVKWYEKHVSPDTYVSNILSKINSH
jgi:glycosyltransferase involved in cell wall biosynthesis